VDEMLRKSNEQAAGVARSATEVQQQSTPNKSSTVALQQQQAAVLQATRVTRCYKLNINCQAGGCSEDEPVSQGSSTAEATSESEADELREVYQAQSQDRMVWALDEFYDESREPSELKQGLILSTGNIRRIKKDTLLKSTAELQQHMWASMANAQADIVGLSDTGLEKPGGKAGAVHPHYSSGKAAKKAKAWGGDQIRWTMTQGTRGKRGRRVVGETELGTVLTAHEKIRA
jgi:hypothetical protein